MAFKKTTIEQLSRLVSHLPCSRPGCADAAMVKGQDGGSLCLAHWNEETGRAAREWCEAQGLDTREAKYRYCREQMAKFGIKVKL